MMNWLADYQDELLALEEARGDIFSIDFNDEEQIRKFAEDFKTVLTPLEDGSLDPGDMDKVFNFWWQKFGAFELAAARKEVAIQHRLASLYKRLEQGTEQEWEEYVRLRMRARLDSRLMQGLMRRLAKTE